MEDKKVVDAEVVNEEVKVRKKVNWKRTGLIIVGVVAALIGVGAIVRNNNESKKRDELDDTAYSDDEAKTE